MAYNEIDQRVDSGIQYDKNGRMTHNSRGHSYTFDDKDHLVSVSLSIDSEDQFFYHADDSLASCKESQSTTNFFHSQKRINALETINAEGGLDENSLLTGLDQLIASYSSSKEPTYFLENSGSTTIILQQHEVTAFTYQPYGKQRASKPITQSLLNFGFTQAFTHQSSELIYLRSRHYDPNIMAFLSMDSDYTKENRYAYCEGDPVNYSDPSGHVRSWKWLAVGVGLGLGVLAGVTTGGLALGAIEIWWGTEIATSSVVANFVVAGVSGAFTNVATNAGTALTEYLLPGGPPQIDYGWRRALSDFVVGGGSGMLGVGATLTVGEAARQFTINILGRYIRQGAGVAVAQFSFEQLQHPDEHPNLEELTQSIAIGVVGALIGGHYARQGGQGAGRQRLLSADGQDARTRATTADSLSVELIEKGRLAKFRRHGGDDDHGDSLA